MVCAARRAHWYSWSEKSFGFLKNNISDFAYLIVWDVGCQKHSQPCSLLTRRTTPSRLWLTSELLILIFRNQKTLVFEWNSDWMYWLLTSWQFLSFAAFYSRCCWTTEKTISGGLHRTGIDAWKTSELWNWGLGGDKGRPARRCNITDGDSLTFDCSCFGMCVICSLPLLSFWLLHCSSSFVLQKSRTLLV